MDEALEASRLVHAGWDIPRIRVALDTKYGR
jgi:hypothetical protein